MKFLLSLITLGGLTIQTSALNIARTAKKEGSQALTLSPSRDAIKDDVHLIFSIGSTQGDNDILGSSISTRGTGELTSYAKAFKDALVTPKGAGSLMRNDANTVVTENGADFSSFQIPANEWQTAFYLNSIDIWNL